MISPAPSRSLNLSLSLDRFPFTYKHSQVSNAQNWTHPCVTDPENTTKISWIPSISAIRMADTCLFFSRPTLATRAYYPFNQQVENFHEGLPWPQWLRLCAFNTGGEGSIPCWKAKMSHTMQCGQNKSSMELMNYLQSSLLLVVNSNWDINSPAP